MALVALTPQEIGLRIRWLRIQAGWTEAAHLARQMGESDEGIFTKLEKGKSQSPQRLFAVAVHCVGRQNVIDDLDVVIGFLNGTKGEDGVWVARESNPEPTDSRSVVLRIFPRTGESRTRTGSRNLPICAKSA